MRREVVQGYMTTARQIARYFSNGSVDALGNDRDDYVAELVLQAYEAWRKHGYLKGFGSSSEGPYVCRAMWNRARDLARSANARQRNVGTLPMLSEPQDDVNEEARLEAREELRVLGSSLRGWYRDLLAASGEGDWDRAYARERGVHPSRIYRARAKAAQLLCAK